MLMCETDELNIQKCVDDELSSKELSALLRRLDSINDGWKSLACGLLEDRRICAALDSRTLQQMTTQFELPQAVPDQLNTAHNGEQKSTTFRSGDAPRIVKVNDVVRHWWSHPVTSLTLCAAIAFVGGLLIPDFNGNRTGKNALTGTGTSTRSNQYPLAADVTQQYRVELQPGGRSVEIPVVTNLNELHQLDRRHPIFSRANGNAQNVQWMMLPVEGNKSMLIPVSEDSSSDMQ